MFHRKLQEIVDRWKVNLTEEDSSEKGSFLKGIEELVYLIAVKMQETLVLTPPEETTLSSKEKNRIAGMYSVLLDSIGEAMANEAHDAYETYNILANIIEKLDKEV